MATQLMTVTLWHGKGKQRQGVVVNGRCLIGRHPDCELRLDVDRVSRKHAEVFVQGGQVCLRDLDSRNGTLLNDRPVPRDQKPVALNSGDRITVWLTEIEVTITTPTAESMAETLAT